MKALFCLGLFALLVCVSAEFPYEIVESTDTTATFWFDCDGNRDCKDPGEVYCGSCGLNTMQCIDDEMCEISCKPLSGAKGVDEFWEYTELEMGPEVKKAGEPITIKLTNTRDNEGLICKANVYKVAGEVTERVSVKKIAENKWASGGLYYGGKWQILPLTFEETRLVRGELVAEETTNCHGEIALTIDEPGFYMLRAVGKDYGFLVGDEEGNTYTCENGVCERELGENEALCPQDCGTGEEPLSPEAVCGDDICEGNETELTCPEDCVPSDGTVAPPQETQTTPPDVPPVSPGQAPQAGADYTLIVLLVLVAIVAIFLIIILTGRLKFQKTNK